MNKPEIDSTSTLFQAGSTASLYLAQAIEMIDQKFGDGYTAEHPDLVAECIRSQTLDFNNTALIAVLYEIKEALDNLSRASDE
jgi:hypothetical protein